MAIFFTGFNALESMMPSLVSQIAPQACRGSAISIYNTFQFAGIFAGGVMGGWIFGSFGEYAVFKVSGIVVLGWFFLCLVMPGFKLNKSVTVDIGHLNLSQRDQLVARIGQLKGIEEVNIVHGETVAYIEVDGEVYDDAELQKLLET
jgi:MFS family permease